MHAENQTTTDASSWTPELRDIVESYIDAEPHHAALLARFHSNVNAVPYLRGHRDFVEQNSYGFGERYFHYMWKLLIDQMPSRFSFLEIGVFKGQVLSLVKLLARETTRACEIVGITPLTSAGDQYSEYVEDDYADAIKSMFDTFELSMENVEILQGLSTDPAIHRRAAERAPFDVVYIDGSHDHDVVVNDLRHFAIHVSRGGFLVMDDASCDLNLPRQFRAPGTRAPEEKVFRGYEDVSRAVRELVDPNPDFRHLFACGHNRVWQRVA